MMHLFRTLAITFFSITMMTAASFAFDPVQETNAITSQIPTAYHFSIGMSMEDYQKAYAGLTDWTVVTSTDYSLEHTGANVTTTLVKQMNDTSANALREELTLSYHDKNVDFYSFRFYTNDQETALTIYNTALKNITKKLGHKDRHASSGNTDGWYYNDGKATIKLQATINRMDQQYGRYMVVISRSTNQ